MMKDMAKGFKKPIQLILIGLLIFQLTGCDMLYRKKKSEGAEMPFYIGTYTNGESKGIYQASLLRDGTFGPVKLAAEANNPSYLAFDAANKILIAGNEIKHEDGMGMITTWMQAGDTLNKIDMASSGGAHPCFVAVNERGYILAGNYSGGNLGLLKMGSGGKLSGLLDVAQHEGSDITSRQEAPHVHSVWFEPDGSGIIAVDLGTNELWFYSLDEENGKLNPRHPEKLAMESGAGPRHLAFHPNKNWFYVLNELNSSITRIHKNSDGGYEVKETISTLPNDFSGENLCAHIVVSSDGRFVYASNRGHNSIAIFEVDEETGVLKCIGHESVRGNWPRHFAFSHDEEFLVIANQYSGNLVSFKRNSGTGLLEFVDETRVADPVCVLFTFTIQVI
jgi:6-phosphogluconolactonase